MGSGKQIINLVQKMVDSRPNAIAVLDDVSNVKELALITTGKSYYEHFGFHYKISRERKNFQKAKINGLLFLHCVTQRMKKPMELGSNSFEFDEHLKRRLLGALRSAIGYDFRRVEEFWGIYRKVMKRAEFHELRKLYQEAQKTYHFEQHLQRSAKTYFFTTYVYECLQEQISEKIDFSDLDRMSYP